MSAPRQRAIMRVIAGGYFCLVPLLVWQAEQDEPLLHPDALIAAAAAGIAVLTVASAALILRPRAIGHSTR